ncbi:MAG: uracil phosphoribosyltransferase [Marinilabiliales bacterium]
MIINLGQQNSIFNQYISEIRDATIQKDSMRFRKNLERAGEIFAYEVSKKLNYKKISVTTPLGIAEVPVLDEKIVISSILRAGLPIHNGILNVFDKSENSFISAYRKYNNEGSFEIKIEYISSVNIEDKVLILTDPMLATGASMFLAYRELVKFGKPKHTHIISLIASKEGLEYMKKKINNQDITIWVGAIDDELTVKSYIVPGLGDAGDLAFGCKE